MLISPLDLRFCLDKACEMGDHYNDNVHHDGRPGKSVDQLLQICRQYLGKTIRVNYLNIHFQHNSINGMFLRVNDEYEIYLRREMESDWNRFVLCKELYHVILDDEQYQNVSIYEHLEQAMVAFPSVEIKPGQPVVSEKMAEIAAMQFLFPYDERKGIKDNNAELNLDAIAKKYRIPERLVELYLSDSYIANIGAFMPKPL